MFNYDNEVFDINYDNINDEKQLTKDENQQIIPNKNEYEMKKLNNESLASSSSDKADLSFLEENSIDEDDSFLSKKTKRLDVNELDKFLYSKCEKILHPKEIIKSIEKEETLEKNGINNHNYFQELKNSWNKIDSFRVPK